MLTNLSTFCYRLSFHWTSRPIFVFTRSYIQWMLGIPHPWWPYYEHVQHIQLWHSWPNLGIISIFKNTHKGITLLLPTTEKFKHVTSCYKEVQICYTYSRNFVIKVRSHYCLLHLKTKRLRWNVVTNSENAQLP